MVHVIGFTLLVQNIEATEQFDLGDALVWKITGRIRSTADLPSAEYTPNWKQLPRKRWYRRFRLGKYWYETKHESANRQ